MFRKFAKIESMKTTIVAGMLGSGKTSFIQNYLKGANERIVVLVNDFGKVGIDGEVLSQQCSDVIELPSGCVCCTLKFDLMNTLARVLKELHPEHLMIEPSGIATVSAVVEALNSSGINRYTVITLIDPTEFVEFYESEAWGNFLQDQIKTADIILINKIDLATKDNINKAEQLLQQLNNKAIIVKSTYGRLDHPIEQQSHHIDTKETAHPVHLQTHTLNLKGSLSLQKIEEFMDNIANGQFGHIIRAKGLIQTDRGSYRVDYASGRIHIEPLSWNTSESRIVIIGENIDAGNLENAIN